MSAPHKQIRAHFTDETIRVYQAYRAEIAVPAVAAQTFVPPFKIERMTWIKPSFLWMMYRCGWAEKPGQEHVLAIDISRDGWAWALSRACLSSASKAGVPANEWSAHKVRHPVRVQWDPERSVRLGRLEYRSIQVGLTGEAVRRYVDDWIVKITDVTPLSREIHSLVNADEIEAALALLPSEAPYPARQAWEGSLGITPGSPAP